MGRQLKPNLQIIIMRENEIHIRKEEGGREGWRGSRKGDGEEDSGAAEAEGIKGGGEWGAVRRWKKWRETREIPLLPFDLLGCYSSERHGAGKRKTRGRHQWLTVEKTRGICIFCYYKLFVFYLVSRLSLQHFAVLSINLFFSYVGFQTHGYGSVYKHKGKEIEKRLIDR